MKGLLIKDWKLMKNNAMFISVIIFVSMACAAGLKNSFFALGYATALISIFSVNTISYDEYDNGMAFLFSLPISKKIYVQEKYIFAILISAVGITVSTSISVAVSLFLGESYHIEEWIGVLTLSLCFIVLIQVVIMPVRIRFDAQKHNMAMLVVFGVMAAVFGGAFAIAESFGFDVEGFYDGIIYTKAWVALVSVLILGAIFMWISYKISLKLMEKREF